MHDRDRLLEICLSTTRNELHRFELQLATATIARTAALPPLITEGSQSAGVQAPGMMAYAAVSPELTAVARSPRQARAAAQADAKRANQGRKITLTAARLDRSNYAVLTAAQSIASAPPANAMGATVAPLRSAARAEASYLMFAPPLAAPVLMGSLEARR